jgi:hypothetical protein
MEILGRMQMTLYHTSLSVDLNNQEKTDLISIERLKSSDQVFLACLQLRPAYMIQEQKISTH